MAQQMRESNWFLPAQWHDCGLVQVLGYEKKSLLLDADNCPSGAAISFWRNLDSILACELLRLFRFGSISMMPWV
ncbi:hypothetical protein EJ04DRAFT_257646 [Polyplosphaeria fusca]|uniref:Uncharacterized protein n=1 Tax=Polyplosphaeria fusca TaxID=682080 RepID=A0A9P4QWP3_9PLEO|nr:hypothetical protein EJ04DRAFT_257646 [Polyplosphaeria fusca]